MVDWHTAALRVERRWRESPVGLFARERDDIYPCMQWALKLIGGAVVLAVSFLATLWLVDHYVWLACPSGERFALTKPFEKSKNTYYAPAPALTAVADGPGAITRSKFVVCEDHFQLGPAHSGLDEIAAKGGGRFSHWMGGFQFSTSDNSNPNTNGRVYTAVRVP